MVVTLSDFFRLVLSKGKGQKVLPSWKTIHTTWFRGKKESFRPICWKCARLVFTAKEGTAVATSLIDLGGRFRLIINNVNCKQTEKPMPKLPVATAFWTPEPNLQTGAEAWILAGAHITPHSPMT